MAEASIDIVHNAGAHRFEAHVDGSLARCEYRRVGNVMQVHHTEVPAALEGRGIAGQLVRATLDHAKASGLRVAPYCSYVRSWMKRHPEYQDLLAPGQSL
jgi:predicted GNAT family acetyltransferase